MVKISDVARLAGVSPATVSRVLNGTAGVSPEKREKVSRAIDETGFKPNEVARSLYKKSSRIIGYIIPSILNIFINEIGRAIEDEAFRNGYKVILCNTDESPQKEADYINMLISMNADGIIIVSNNDGLEAEISMCPFPVVVFDQEVNAEHSVACVQSDNYQGGHLAAEHLLKCGCRHIVQMRGPQKYISGVERFRGYCDACAEHLAEPRFMDCGYDFEEGLDCTERIMHDFPDTDGILASSDLTALSAYKVLLGIGKHIPEDVMLVGYDDIRLSALTTPELTTIAQPMESIGRLSVRIILDRISGKQHLQLNSVLPVELKIRQTTMVKKN